MPLQEKTAVVADHSILSTYQDIKVYHREKTENMEVSVKLDGFLPEGRHVSFMSISSVWTLDC